VESPRSWPADPQRSVLQAHGETASEIAPAASRHFEAAQGKPQTPPRTID